MVKVLTTNDLQFKRFICTLVWFVQLGVFLSFGETAYKLRIGDVLTYYIEEDREEPKSVTVSLGGEIFLPQIGRVKVKDLTLDQASQQIKGLLEKDFYHKATVNLSIHSLAPEQKPADSVSLKTGANAPVEPAKPILQVVVVGQVKNQGVLEMPPQGQKFMLSRALIKSGGFSNFANARAVQIVRRDAKGGSKRIAVDAHSIFTDGKLENDVELMPDDMIIVPEKFLNF